MKSVRQRTPEAPGEQFRIAAVSQLTGIPEPTIRMWEYRYSAVKPARSSGNGRLYSRADVERLQLLKAAVAAGHAISTVAPLSDEQLQKRLSEIGARPSSQSDARDGRVIVCGAALADRLGVTWSNRSGLEIVQVLDSLPEHAVRLEVAAVVIVEVATLQPSTLKRIRQLRSQSRAELMVVIYGFGSRSSLARLDQDGIIALAMPADPAHLARLCVLVRALPQRGTASAERRLLQRAAPRRYDDSFLATTARMTSSVRCECPNHLADLLMKMNAFEQYSLECEHANAADASLHALLHAAAAQCRELLELSLQKVLEHEGVSEVGLPST